MTTIAGIFSTVWPSIQQTVEGVMTVISSVISTVMGVIQGIITVVLGLINGDWTQVFSGLQTITDSIFNGIMGIISGVGGAISGFISGMLGTIQAVWEGAWGAVTSVLQAAWDGIGNAVSAGVSGVVSWFTGLPGQIMGAIGGIAGQLYSAGAGIISSFLDGLKSMWGSVTDFVGGIGDWIIEHKGPPAYDAVMLRPAGKSIMQSLRDGLLGGFRDGVEDAIDYVNGSLSEIGIGVKPDMGPWDSFSKDLGSGANDYNMALVARAASLDSTKAGTRPASVVQNFSTKVVRADSDLYAAAPIMYANARRAML
jgi:phage-related protein